MQRTKEFTATEGYVLFDLDNYSYGNKAYCKESIIPNIIEVKESDMEYIKSLIDTVNEENVNLVKEEIFLYLNDRYDISNTVKPVIHGE